MTLVRLKIIQETVSKLDIREKKLNHALVIVHEQHGEIGLLGMPHLVNLNLDLQ